MYIRRKLLLLFALVGFFVTAVSGQSPAGDAELQRILSRTRDTYATAAAWYFEHRISIEETDGSGSAVKLVDVSLVTANRVSPSRPAGITAAALCAERCRLSSTTTDRRTTLVVRDGTNSWMYSSARGEYMKGATLRDIAMSVQGSLLLAAHLTPLGGLEGDAWSDVRRLGNEEVEIGGVRRDSYVVEATLKTNGLRLDAMVRGERPPPDVDLFSTPSGLVSLLQLQGLATVQSPSFYFAADGAAAAKVRLWIDQQSYLILRRTTTQTAAKVVPSGEPAAAPPTTALPPTREVTLRLDHTFSRAAIADAVENALFTFNPPDGSREVPNIRATVPAVSTSPSSVSQSDAALDAVKIDPKHYKVEFENENIRILRTSYGPHEKSPMHYHPAYWYVNLTENQYKMVTPDSIGSLQTTERLSIAPTSDKWPGREDGTTKAGSHSVENLLDHPAESIVVELKNSPEQIVPIASADSMDAVKVDPEHYKLEFENLHIRILRIQYGPRETSPMHHHPASVGFSFTETHFRSRSPDGRIASASRA